MEVKVGKFYEKELNDLNSKIEQLKSFAKTRAIQLATTYPIPYSESSGLSLARYLSFLEFDEYKGLNISADDYIRVVIIAEEWIEKQEEQNIN